MKRLITTEIPGGGVEKFTFFSPGSVSGSVSFASGFKVIFQRKQVNPSCARTRKKNLLSIEFLAISNLLSQSVIGSSSTSSSLTDKSDST